MATRIVLPAINARSSKADEKAFLRKLASKVPGTYLESLFTEQFIRWVEEMINADLPADMQKTLLNANLRTQELAGEAQDANKRIDHLRSMCAEKDGQIARALATMETYRSLAGAHKAKADEWEEYAHECEASRSDKLQIIDAHEQTIRNLKAQIYDLQMELSETCAVATELAEEADEWEVRAVDLMREVDDLNAQVHS